MIVSLNNATAATPSSRWMPLLLVVLVALAIGRDYPLQNLNDAIRF
jgi:hypothetical protein